VRYFVGDCETTGLGGPPAVMACEIALIEVDLDLNVLGEWETLINPGIPIEPKAAELHGITNEMVTAPGVPTIEEALAEILGEEQRAPLTMVAHNAKFDRRFFGPHLNIVNELCTLELARKHMPHAPNHRLGTLREHCNLQVQQEHAAMGDIMIVLDLLRHLVPLTGRSFAQLVGGAAKASMLYIMPFGKHKGTPIAELDVDYRNWLLQQDISPDLRYTLDTLAKAFV